MSKAEQLSLVPEQKIDFSGQWFRFDGFENFPEQIRDDFSIKRGSWKLLRIDGEHHGVKIEEPGKVLAWWNAEEEEKNCHAIIIQLLNQRGGYIPRATVIENFLFSIRGYHLDIARGGVPKLETFKKIIRWLFLLKYNALAIYFEDLYPWKSFPDIGLTRGRITDAELKELVDYAQAYGIEVIPSLELLGHMENILSLPEYSHLRELWWVPNDGCIDLTNGSAKELAEGLLRDVLSFARWKHIHIGGDETWSLGRGRSLNRTQTFCAPDLYLEHYRSLLQIVREHGKIPIVWGDMLIGMTLPEPERKMWQKVASSEIWDYPLIANWDYEPAEEQHFERRIKSVGHLNRQLACPSLSNFGKLCPNYDVATSNMRSFIAAARKNRLPGFLITAWGDDGAECLFSLLDPLILAAMEIAEGTGEWERKWLALGREDPKVFTVRKLLGCSEVAERLKRAVFTEGSGRGFVQERPGVAATWKQILNTVDAEELRLPADLEFLVSCLRVGTNMIEKKSRSKEFIALSSMYSTLWLAERKKEGLARILTRFWGSAGFVELEGRKTD